MCTGMIGRNCVALYPPSTDIFPGHHHTFTKALSVPSIEAYIRRAAMQIGYAID